MCTNSELQDQIEVIHQKTDNNCKDIAAIMKVVKPLEDLYPALKESVELKAASEKYIGSWKAKAKTATIFLTVIAVLITILAGITEMFIRWKIIK